MAAQRRQQQQQALLNESKAEELSESADLFAFVGSTAGEQQPGSNPHGPRSGVCCGGGDLGSRAPVPGQDHDRCCTGVVALSPRGASRAAPPSSSGPDVQLVHRQGGEQQQEQQQGGHVEEALRERLPMEGHGRERVSEQERARERWPRDAVQRPSAMGAAEAGQRAGASTSGHQSHPHPHPHPHPHSASHRHHHESRAVNRDVKEAACRAIKDLMAPLFARNHMKGSEGQRQRQAQGQGATSSDGGSSGAGAQERALLDKEAFKEVAREGTNELCAEVARMGLRGGDAVRVVLTGRGAGAARDGAGADGGRCVDRCELEDGEVWDSGGEVGGKASLPVVVLVRVLEGRGLGHLVKLVRETAAGTANRKGQGGEGGTG